MIRPTILAILGVLALTQGGCISATVNRNTTTGQELLDLQKAHAAGAITDAEYQAAKSRMVSEDCSSGSAAAIP